MSPLNARALLRQSAKEHGWTTIEENNGISIWHKRGEATLRVRFTWDGRVCDAVYFHSAAPAGLGQHIEPRDRNKRNFIDYLLVRCPTLFPMSPALVLENYRPSWSVPV